MISSAPSTKLTRAVASLSLGLSVACNRPPPPNGEPPVEPPAPVEEPSGHQALLEALDDPGRETEALVELRRLVLDIEASQDEQARAAAAAAFLPSLSARWSTADQQVREVALVVALALAGPEAAPLWQQALVGGTPAEALAALEGLARTELPELGPAVVDRLGRELGDLDGEDDPRIRLVAMLVRALGQLRIESTVELLIRTLETPELPTSIARELATALGRIGDPRAVDALIAAQFRILDSASTLSISERSQRALGAIGEPALPGVLATFAGTNRRVNELAEDHSIDEQIVQFVALRAMAIIGSSRATEPILASFPRAGCGREAAAADEDELYQIATARAFHANTLGFIADPAAVPTLCACNGVSKEPTDVWEIASALGRIGGEQAFGCLAKLVERGRYDLDAVEPGFELEIRWQAFRWAVIAAPPSKVDALSKLLDGATPKVQEQIRRKQLDVGIAVLRACGEDVACYRAVLDDPSRHPFERELAAFNLARRSTPGDVDLAAAFAAAFEAPDPEVRIHMAWLTGKVAAGHACPECIHNLERVMTIEGKTKDMTMQGAWLMAWQTLDKLHVAGR